MGGNIANGLRQRFHRHRVSNAAAKLAIFLQRDKSAAIPRQIGRLVRRKLVTLILFYDGFD